MSEKSSIALFCQEFRSISDTVLASKENQRKNALLFHSLPRTYCIVIRILLMRRCEFISLLVQILCRKYDFNKQAFLFCFPFFFMYT